MSRFAPRTLRFSLVTEHFISTVVSLGYPSGYDGHRLSDPLTHDCHGPAMPSTAPTTASTDVLSGRRVVLAGKLAGMSRRDAQSLLRSHGAVCPEGLDATVDLLVVGEHEFPLGPDDEIERLLDELDGESDQIEVISETQLWQRLGLIDGEQNVYCLYTPGMLADLLKVPAAVIRRWRRRGLIVPIREVRRLPYFDFQEVATARRLAELLAAGTSPAAVEKKLASLGRLLPGVHRPLAQLSVIVEGKDLLLRQGEGLIDADGQLRIDFEADQPPEVAIGIDPIDIALIEDELSGDAPLGGDRLCQLAVDLEDAGRLEEAAEMYRAVLAAEGPSAEVSFLLAELLYRQGDLGAARERYYAAIELDEDFVEARANLGCVLADAGQQELAVAAFRGALAYHADYPDAHYHLAHTLDDLRERDEAETHWRAFLELSATSPWAEEARIRLGILTP